MRQGCKTIVRHFGCGDTSLVSTYSLSIADTASGSKRSSQKNAKVTVDRTLSSEVFDRTSPSRSYLKRTIDQTCRRRGSGLKSVRNAAVL